MQGNKDDQTMDDSGVSEEPRTEEEEWIIQGERGIIFDPGTTDGDLYRCFSAAAADRSTKAMVQIMLKHSK